MLENPQVMEYTLPVLRADTALYRNYLYNPGEPFSFPVFAYGGSADPNVRTEHVDAWREQTSGRFARREFAGGHFFIHSEREVFLAALREDLR